MAFVWMAYRLESRFWSLLANEVCYQPKSVQQINSSWKIIQKEATQWQLFFRSNCSPLSSTRQTLPNGWALKDTRAGYRKGWLPIRLLQYFVREREIALKSDFFSSLKSVIEFENHQKLKSRQRLHSVHATCIAHPFNKFNLNSCFGSEKVLRFGNESEEEFENLHFQCSRHLTITEDA